MGGGYWTLGTWPAMGSQTRAGTRKPRRRLGEAFPSPLVKKGLVADQAKHRPNSRRVKRSLTGSRPAIWKPDFGLFRCSLERPLCRFDFSPARMRVGNQHRGAIPLRAFRPLQQLFGRGFDGTDLPDLPRLGPVDDTYRRMRKPDHGLVFTGNFATIPSAVPAKAEVPDRPCSSMASFRITKIYNH